MDRGYISIHRCIEDDELWLKEPFTRGQAWVDLIMLANYKESSFYIRGNLVLVGRGQVARSETHLAKRWQWSRDKVRRFLSYLSTTEKVIQQKSKIISIITIVKYDIYQETRQQTRQQKNIRKTSDNTTYNKDNKENKVNKDNKRSKTYAPSGAKKFIPVEFLITQGVEKKVAQDWLSTRKAKRLANTETAFKGVAREVERSGKGWNEVISICCERGWGGFKAEWLNNIPSNGNGKMNETVDALQRFIDRGEHGQADICERDCGSQSFIPTEQSRSNGR